MAWMSDEKYLLMQDTRDKKNTARSARSTRTHCGKSGAVKFPSDYMTAKELKNMNGECKTYRMNSPITWDEFKTWPDEHKITYIKLLRAKYNVPDKYIAEMMGVSRPQLCKLIGELNIGTGKKENSRRVWDREGFLAWSSGAKDGVVKSSETPVEEAEEAVEEITETVEPAKEATDEKKVGMEEAVEAIRESDAWPLIKFEENHGEAHTECAEPIKGEMTFEGNVDDILRTVKTLLGGKKGHIEIEWRLV